MSKEQDLLRYLPTSWVAHPLKTTCTKRHARKLCQATWERQPLRYLMMLLEFATCSIVSSAHVFKELSAHHFRPLLADKLLQARRFAAKHCNTCNGYVRAGIPASELADVSLLAVQTCLGVGGSFLTYGLQLIVHPVALIQLPFVQIVSGYCMVADFVYR